MITEDQLRKFQEFLEGDVTTTLLEHARQGKKFLIIDFRELSRFNIELAEDLLTDPEDTLTVLREAIRMMDLPTDDTKFHVQVRNLPPSCKRLIAAKRVEDLNKLVAFEGFIRSKSSALGRTTWLHQECLECGEIMEIPQGTSKQLKRARKCVCGNKSRFREDNIMINIQKLELEELPENVKGTSQPQRLKVLLQQSLVDPMYEPKFNPGAKVLINGILKELPITTKSGNETIDSDYLLEAVYMENIEAEEIDLHITDNEMQAIQSIAESPDCISILQESLAPSLFGRDEIKQGILVQLVGGCKKVKKDGTVSRGDIHILIIGDPGCGKSAMLQRIETLIPHARVANGKGASGVGLTCAVVRDDFVGWTFQAGTLVLAHKNIAIIDEFDKMSSDDRDQIHEALEQQHVTVSKAGVQARLSCECSLLAGANPKYGNFDLMIKTLAEQIELPPTILNRFDLIFPVVDKADLQQDKMMGDKIISGHVAGCKNCTTVDTPLLRKYIMYAKTLTPTITPDTADMLVDHFVDLRQQSSGDNGGARGIPISPRQLEGLVRLSEGYAKLRLSKTVDKRDAEHAINLMTYCLQEIAFDKETGKLDMARVTGDPTATTRSSVSLLMQIVNEFDELNKKIIPLGEFKLKANSKGLDDNQINDALDIMKKKGDVFIPKKGYIGIL